MKNPIQLCLLSILLLLAACSGSDAYQGDWKATDAEGNKFNISFEPKSFKVTAADGTVTAFQYTQNAVNINNSVKSYTLQLSDGRTYKIVFPLPKDAAKAIVVSADGVPVYALGRTDYVAYDDLYKLAE